MIHFHKKPQERRWKRMKPATILLAAALLNTIAVAEAVAECQIADAKLEEAISRNPQLHGPSEPSSRAGPAKPSRRSFHASLVRPPR